MLLTCNECEWDFHIKSALIKDAGSNVRCSKCGNIWKIYPAEPDDEVLVLETWEQDEGQRDDDGLLDELIEPTAIEKLEQDTDEDPQPAMAEISEPVIDPDFDNDGGELPDLEDLFNFDEEEAADPALPDEENLPEPAFLEEGEPDVIDLSDLEDLVKSDIPSPSMKSGGDNPGPEKPAPGILSIDEEEAGSKEFELVPEVGEEIDVPDSLDIFEEEDEQLPEMEQDTDEEPELTLADYPESEDGDDPMVGIEAILESDDDELFNIDILLEKEAGSTDNSTDTLDPTEFEPKPDKILLDEETDLEGFLEPIGELEETGDIIIADEHQPEGQTDTSIEVPEPVTVGVETNDLPDTRIPNGCTHEIETDYPVPQVGRIKSRRNVLAVLAALLLVPCLLTAFYLYIGINIFPAGLNVQVPFISDFFDTGKPDAAINSEIKLLEPTVTDKFLDNHKEGELFIITGQVRNAYDHPRNHIRVTAKLYTEHDIELRAATVYCGGILSDRELSELDIATIHRHLHGRSARSNTNQPVGTGMHIPFMVVFHDLPDELDKYSVEVLDSSPMSTGSNISEGSEEKNRKRSIDNSGGKLDYIASTD